MLMLLLMKYLTVGLEILLQTRLGNTFGSMKVWVGSFLMNVGFTMFAERKIYARLHGEKARHFHAIIGYRALEESVKNYGPEHPLTNLVPK